MRLLDLIAQGRGARVHSDDGQELPGANRFSAEIRNCSLQYILTDELARCATQLAYAEGDRLSACMDLIHVSAHCLWVEWPDGPRREALQAIPTLEVKMRSLGSGRPGGWPITHASLKIRAAVWFAARR
jgi:hypothetical protein